MDHSAELHTAFQRRIDTYRAGDVAAYLKNYAPDATLFVAGAQLNLDQVRTHLKSTFDGGGKVLELQISKPSSVRFSEGGDAATYNFTWRELFHYPDGHEKDSEYYESDVWFRRSGEWKLVHLHLTTISERTTKPVKHQ